MVFRVLRRTLGPDELLDDLAQEVFLCVFRKLPELREPQALKAFIISTTVLTARAELRRRRTRRAFALFDNRPSIALEVTARELEAREALRRFDDILNRLNARDRHAFVLRFIEVMAPWATQEPLPVGEAIAAVATRLALSVFLMLAGMMLAVNVMEICFLGPMSRTAYKLIAIAVGPGALYGIMSFAGGETYGAMIGTFLSVAIYAVLFWSLMRLELWDTSICVVVTWILVTAANYAAYRAQGLMQDSWV